jgi:RimJ/RimL family protein N-acetyltransferase
VIRSRAQREDVPVHAIDLAAGGELTTERLLLRPPKRTDAAALHQAIAETLPELSRWLPWARPGHGRLDTRRYLRGARLGWARRSAFEFVVEELESETLVGIASVHRIDWTRSCAGLGYWMRTTYQRRGYATEAARAAALWAFRHLELHRLELHIALANAASHRVAQRLAARREGIARDAERVGGRYLDHVQYALLGSDPEPETWLSAGR